MANASPRNPADSNKSLDEEVHPRQSDRQKHSTEKGLGYKRDLRKQAVITAKRSWRKQINTIHSQLATRKNVYTLTAGCEDLESKMVQFSQAHEALEAMVENSEERRLLYEDYETVSRENNDTLKLVSERIKDLELEMNSRSSNSSRSTKTSKISHRSRHSSYRPLAGNSALSQRKRVELEGDVASLRVKMALVKEKQEKELENRTKMDELRRKRMEIIREEERTKEELRVLEENFRIKEELAQKEARMIASIQQEENDPFLPEMSLKPPVEFGSKELMEKFLHDQLASVSDDEQQLFPNQSPDITPTSLAPFPKICTYSQGITPPTTSSVTKPSLSPLNPFSPMFKPIYSIADTTAVTTALNPSLVTFTSPPSAEKCGVKPECQTANRDPEESVQLKLLEVAKLLAETQNQSRLPLPEPGIFSGDLLQYPIWVKAFESLIEGRAVKPSERLHFLGKYLEGDAKEVVDGFILLDSEDAYERAKEMLDKRFGDPFAVATACRKKVESWQKIHPNDGPGLRKYADFLVQCEQIMKKIGSLRILNDEQENQRLTLKLPSWAINRWSRAAFHWKEDKGTFPPFSEFVKFVVKEADIACDPVLSSSVLRESDNGRTWSERGKSAKPSPNEGNRFGKPRPFQRRPLDVDAFATNLRWDTQEKKTTLATKSCLLCNKSHNLDTCYEFMKKSIIERKAFASTKGLCFGCLEQGHLSRDCPKRIACNICKRPHPTSLHGDFKRRDGESNNTANDPNKPPSANKPAACFASTHSKDQANSMIVPVWLSHRSDPDKERLVYALLDDQSNTTFVGQNTLDHLGVSGPETSLLLSTMHATDEPIKSRKIEGLVVQDFHRQVTLQLPKAFSREIIPAKREQIPRPESALQWPHLKKIANQIAPYQCDIEIGILIGSDYPRAIMPREVIPGGDESPYALRSDLGWGIIGRISQPLAKDNDEDEIGVSHRIHTCEVWDTPNPLEDTSRRIKKTCNFSIQTQVKEVINPSHVIQMFETDFSERRAAKQVSLSQDDITFLKKMEDGTCRTEDGHYQMPLPLRNNTPKLPNNKSPALRRLFKLQSRFENDAKYRRDYTAFMQDIIERGYAEEVPHEQRHVDNGKQWYIPHHGVYHPQKPDKIRVVFDCSATHMGESLNKHLLQGPDLTNSLVGVLCRFRQEPLAFMCDLEAMFHQFKVAEKDRDFLRFYWWKNGDTSKNPIEYRMTVHLFGAASSPGCANFGLKKAANDHESEFGTEAATFIRKNFYVDDGLKSVATVSEAVSLIQNTKDICAKAGMRLHKFISNSKEVIATIGPEDRAKELKDLDLNSDALPMERALGVHWCVETDTFQFRITLQDKPLTRRGILSTVSSVYDPLGFLAPVVLTGRQILQSLCRDKSDWDDPVPDPLRQKWEKWRNSLCCLEKLKIQRCFKPHTFGKLQSAELHHFSDASDHGYGQCSYLRLVDDKGQVHCSFVMGKARVTPLKPVTIPRLELTAALLSVKVSTMLREELEFDNLTDVFYTDSQVVLGYIKNDARRFHVFVANRVQQIRESSTPDQWRYIATKENPADESSRGLSPQDLLDNSRWLNGPAFLWEQELPPKCEKEVDSILPPNDPEVKKVQVLTTVVREESMATIPARLKYFSDWHRAKKAIAVCLKFKALLQGLSKKQHSKEEKQRPFYKTPLVDELRHAELEIIKSIQKEVYTEEIKILQSLKLYGVVTDRTLARTRNTSMKKTSSLYRLDPFLDENGVLRVGGRIKRALVPFDVKHPIILPSKNHVTALLVRHHHERISHQGRGMTLNDLRSHGYWIVGGSSEVATYISKCVTCRKLRGALQEQKMADLPKDRLEPAPPFTYCGVDLFGPWHIKEGRRELKRYGVLFTCISSRAVHLETVISLETDSFINSLRRFLCRRGPVRQIRCDRGTNFVGAKCELDNALSTIDQSRVRQFLLERNCDWVEFQFNVPSASHMGGIWERQIRTVRNVLAVLLDQCGTQLDDESLRTFMAEAEAVVNSRPLTVESLSSPEGVEPLTPNHLLTAKSKVVLPPPGVFQRADLYLRKRWRRVQHLANEFWTRWKREYLQSLQERQKWTRPRRNLAVNDVVIVKNDNLPRNLWQIARVENVFPDTDGYVRKVKLAIGDASLSNKGLRIKPVTYLERPVQKLVLLVPNDGE